MISLYGSWDRTSCTCEAQFHLSCLKSYTTDQELWYNVGIGTGPYKLEISCTSAYEQVCCLIDEILVKKKRKKVNCDDDIPNGKIHPPLPKIQV